MKSLLSVVAFLLAFAAGAAEIVLVEGSVAEVPAIGLVGVEYKVLYDDATYKVIFKAKGETSAANCALIFHAVSIQDDVGKSVTGYNGNCGHTPGPTDVPMTDDGYGWLTFSIDATDYTPSLGMFLTVVLRQDNARNLERFFGICSMTAPNDWGSFDGSWANRIKIAVPTPQIKINAINISPYLPGTANPNDASSMGKNLTLSYTITPPGFVADSAILTIKDKNGVVVYNNAISKSSGTYVAKWLVSTPSLRSINANNAPYEIKATMTKGTYSCEDAKPLDVVTSTVTVEAEKSQTTGAPLTECMEGRKVTFTATAKGFVSEASSHKIQYVYYFAHADGTVWTVSQWALTLKNNYTAKADNVPSGNTNHYFQTPIYVVASDTYTHNATSPTIQIKVYQLWIDYFRNNAPAKDWKVAVGTNIAYNAFASSDCINWKWDMQDGVPDVWNPTGGNAKMGTAMIIPTSDLPSAKNKYFGDARGTVDVACKDEEGNAFHFYSTSMNPAKKAQVFFPPDIGSVNPINAVSDVNPPCWFKFWRQKDSVGTRAVDGLQDFAYKHKDTYGGSNYKVNLFWFDSITLEVCKLAAGVHYPSGLLVNGVEYGDAAGIDCCREVVVHEKQHNIYAKAILVKHFTDNDPPVPGYGYLGDFIPDSDEAALGCSTNQKDTYNLAILKAPVYAGYGDAEYGCLFHAKGKKGNASADWSKGGKQW